MTEITIGNDIYEPSYILVNTKNGGNRIIEKSQNK